MQGNAQQPLARRTISADIRNFKIGFIEWKHSCGETAEKKRRLEISKSVHCYKSSLLSSEKAARDFAMEEVYDCRSLPLGSKTKCAPHKRKSEANARECSEFQITSRSEGNFNTYKLDDSFWVLQEVHSGRRLADLSVVSRCSKCIRTNKRSCNVEMRRTIMRQEAECMHNKGMGHSRIIFCVRDVAA